MSSQYVRNEIHRRIDQVISDEGWDVPVIEIVNFRATPDPDRDWIAIEFFSADETQITTGAPGDNTFRETGDFFIHYATATGKGPITVFDRLETIRAALRFTLVNGIRIDAVSPPDTTAAASLANVRGAWWGASILTSYEYDVRA